MDYVWKTPQVDSRSRGARPPGGWDHFLICVWWTTTTTTVDDFGGTFVIR